MKSVDALVQCCYLTKAEVTPPALERLARKTIASSGQVGKTAAHAEVRKLILTHFRKKSDKMMQALAEDVRGDYSGELYIGEDSMMIDI